MIKEHAHDRKKETFVLGITQIKVRMTSKFWFLLFSLGFSVGISLKQFFFLCSLWRLSFMTVEAEVFMIIFPSQVQQRSSTFWANITNMKLKGFWSPKEKSPKPNTDHYVIVCAAVFKVKSFFDCCFLSYCGRSRQQNVSKNLFEKCEFLSIITCRASRSSSRSLLSRKTIGHTIYVITIFNERCLDKALIEFQALTVTQLSS